MLNKRVMAKVHNEITGKDIRYTADDKREIQKKYRWYFGGKKSGKLLSLSCMRIF